MNKDENIKVKIWKYPGASSIDILDHIKLSLRKAPEQIIIHASMNDISGSSVSYEPEVSDNCVNKALKHFKTNHPQCVSLGYLNINSVRNKLYGISPLIEHNIDIFALAETKLDSLFPESQFLLEGRKKPYRFDVSSRKGGLLVYVYKNIPSKYLRSFHLPNDIQVITIEVNLKQRRLLVVSI